MKDDVDEDDAGASSSSSVSELQTVYGNPRASRNLAEKQRRDNLNSNISTMASLLPMVAGNSRKTDKISILRLAGAYLRYTYTLGQGKIGFLPQRFNGMNLEQFIIDSMCDNGGFFIVVTSTGKIVYISQHVEQQLGHAQAQLLGESLYNYVCPEDHEELTKNFSFNDTQRNTTPALESSDQLDESSNSSDDFSFKEEQRRSFSIRIAQRTVSRREHIQYECFHVSGNLCLANACRNAGLNVNRLKQRENNGTSNDIIFVGIARMLKKRTITELSLLEADKDEYVTRHLVDGRIIFCDHRISVVAGYMAEEVSGKSAFAFMHKDDFRWTMIGLRQMYNKGEGFEHSCYRLVAKNGEFIYLRTHGYLEFDKNTQTVESFVCVNTLMSREDGEKLMKDMKKRFSATINKSIEDGSDLSLTFEEHLEEEDDRGSNAVAGVEDPAQLEDAIIDLISDLPSAALTKERLAPSPLPDPQFYKAAIFSQRLPPASEQVSRMGIKNIEHISRGGKGKGSRSPKATTPVKKSIYPDKKIPELDCSIPSPVSESQANTPIAEKKLTIGEKMIPEQSCHSSDEMVSELDAELTNPYVRTSVVRELKPFEVKLEQVVDNIGVHDSLLNGQRQQQQQCSSAKENLEINLKRRYSEDMNSNSVNGKNLLTDIEACSSLILNDNLNAGTSRKLQINNLKRRLSEDDDDDIDKGENSNVNSCKRLLKDSYPTMETINIEQTSFDNGCSTTQQFTYLYKNSTDIDVSEISLQEASGEYSQIDPSFVMQSSDELLDLQSFQDLPGDMLSSPGLERNSDWMRIIDNLRPVVNIENNFGESSEEQFIVNDDVLSEEIARRQLQLVNGMEMCESQFNAIQRNLDNPALQPQRDRLIQLQADHKVQKQLLKTLQKEHHNIQSIRW
ncbi:circadian locomoter output cycles protein kaput-like isoform X2 [Leptopilina heterotoma]|uniref:circadian locomoter output cycles protein kaput-like isoform X2 n=1 Tax=Leptopilina heterotoma TaxID=63436 RepID=UPI001CA99AFE|nr:circadian locomoter output cycles protein kaput-like isoform X2 [Leptopilina heterotoma]